MPWLARANYARELRASFFLPWAIAATEGSVIGFIVRKLYDGVVADTLPLRETALESYGNNLGIAFQIIDDLLDLIEAAPKSMKWKVRAKVGTRKLWYQEVTEKSDQF